MITRTIYDLDLLYDYDYDLRLDLVAHEIERVLSYFFSCFAAHGHIIIYGANEICASGSL